MSNEMQDWLRDNAVDALQARIAELGAENARLREALTSIEGAASYSRRVWIIETAQTALLGGGE